MNRTFGCLLVLAAIISCAAPPDRPGSLWDSLPPVGGDTAKTVPSQVWRDPATSSDAAGDVSGDPSADAPPVDVRGAVVLNEIYYDSDVSDTDGNLFVELYGTPGLAIGDCRVNFVNGADGRVYDSISIPPGEEIRDDGLYLIADAKTGTTGVTNVAGADLVDNFDPQNGPDAVQLVDSQGQLVDAVGYGDGILPTAQNGLASFEGTAATDVVAGHSLERRQAGLDTDDNLADFFDQEAPTPGGFPAVPQTTAPESTPDTAPSTPVVLNEIYYDAPGTDTDGVLFVEVYGPSQATIGGYQIDFVDGADGSVDDSVTLPSDARTHDSGFYVLADAVDGSSSETNVPGADFVDNFDPANGPDAVRLRDATGALLDVVGYGDGVTPLAQDGFANFEGRPAIDVSEGHSLERSEPGLDSGDNFSDFLDRQTPTPGW